MKFRKKPVVIEAEHWNGQTTRWFEIMKIFGIKNTEVGKIKTLEGTMHAHYGDWIIKGVKGEFYPCKPDIFEQTYEKVEE